MQKQNPMWIDTFLPIEREEKGIDYTKDNVYDAIGRPDLKPETETPEEESQRIKEETAKEDEGL